MDQRKKGQKSASETSRAAASKEIPESLKSLFIRYPSTSTAKNKDNKHNKDNKKHNEHKKRGSDGKNVKGNPEVPTATEEIPFIMITGDDGLSNSHKSPNELSHKNVSVKREEKAVDAKVNIELKKTDEVDKEKETTLDIVKGESLLNSNSLPNLQAFNNKAKESLMNNDEENIFKEGITNELNPHTFPFKNHTLGEDFRRSSLKNNSLPDSNDNSYNTTRSKGRVSFDTSGLQTSYRLLSQSSNRLLTHRLSVESSLGYAETLMHGHYATARLKRMIKEERAKSGKKKNAESAEAQKSKEPRFKRFKKSLRHFVTGYTVQDWAFLTCLGVCAAFLSFFIDLFVEKSITANRWLYGIAKRSENVGYMYISWIMYPLVLVLFSAAFTKMVGPTAIGSGIPEVKTIMKGVVLKEYLTFKTLVAKVVGLIACLGSGLPLGKVGPFVHVASVTSALLSKLFSIFNHIKENESLQIDILTAASAVGVSCTFAAPIGGVLFSVEATATYFAVKNYWRGFYSAMCGALTFRLMSSVFKSEETLTVLFRTDLRQTMPYDVREIFVFVFVGVLCGVLGAGFVWLHKSMVLFVRRRKKLSAILQKSRLLYPAIVSLLIFSATFPPGLGQYMAGELTLKEAVNQLFDNRTWLLDNSQNIEEQHTLQVWKGAWDNVPLTITMFFLTKFWMCAMAATLPVPCGIFIPSFVLGSALGRLVGEGMAVWLPQGIRGKSILPGAYALVGAATFSGAVTHTVSPAVIVFELTGQLAHLLPCVVSTMIAGATANFLQASVYDAMIEIKKLPYLSPSIDTEYCDAHNVTADSIMDKRIPCISGDCTYGAIWKIVSTCKYRAYPFVAEKGSRILAGSLLRSEAKQLLIRHFSHTENLYSDNETDKENDNDNRNRMNDKNRDDDVKLVIDPDLPMTDSFNKKQMLDIEDDLLNEVADFSTCNIDPAPFQVSSKTSLFKVHWLFSLLSLHHAFVTDHGEIVGCLSLNEVREAIQRHVDQTGKNEKKNENK